MEMQKTRWLHHGTSSWRDYFAFNTNHKVIGIQYMSVAFLFFLLGGVLAMIMRAQLASPTSSIVSPDVYNNLISVHGTVMIFVFLIPVFVGMANYFIPLLIGARDMAFPILNMITFWLVLPGAILMLLSLIVGGNASGWSAYPPLSEQTSLGQTLWAYGLVLIGFSSIFGAVNMMVTILTMRAPGMTFMRMPLFCTSMVATSTLIIVGTPVLAGSLFMLILDRTLGMQFFTPHGDPLLWQNLFWFYSHPAVYIMILPGFGVISEVVPVFSRKPINGYKFVAYSSLLIAGLGYAVWAHHMFTSGMNPWLRFPFMVTSFAIAVPTGIKIFNWLATMWGGKLKFTTSLLFCIGFISTFVIGGLSGMFLASVPTDLYVQDTYFIVAHIHYVLFGGSVMLVFAGVYYWFPKITGRLLNETWGKVHFASTWIGFNLTFLVMFWLGLQGMTRRIFTYAPQFTGGNVIATIGAAILGVSSLFFVINAISAFFIGKVAGKNPWHSLSLEWTVSSPPPSHNFDTLPSVDSDPYRYDEIPDTTAQDAGED
ncbi:MAG: cytochrome c oxidase subunit I [Anaerolineae bacterium]